MRTPILSMCLFVLIGLVCLVSGFTYPQPTRTSVVWRQRPQPQQLVTSRRTGTRVILRAEESPSSKHKDGSRPSKTPFLTSDGAENVGLLEAVRDAAVSASTDLLYAARWGAANALTASLPDEQREELLNNLITTDQQTTALPSGASTTKAEEADDAIVERRASVQEEIAVAVAEEARLNRERWEREREQMTKQMEDAANERVRNELAVQKKRLEREKKEAIEEMEAEKRRLETEKGMLKEQFNSLQVGIGIGGEERGAVELKLRKRKQQEEELDDIEQKLRQRIKDIKKEKGLLSKLREEVVLAKEKEKQTTPGEVGDNLPHYSPKEYRALSNEEKGKLKAQRDVIRTAPTAADNKAGDVHPVLGSVVSDLGYKRIHFVPSGRLGTIPVWNKNRIYRHDRAKSMATDKVKSMHLGFPGAICLHEDSNGKLSILDGQHRVGMMATLREKRNREAAAAARAESSSSKHGPHLDDNDYMFDRVLVEVYPQPRDSNLTSEEHAQEVFLEINKAEPIKLVDMPGVASAADRKVITDAVAYLQGQFPHMFSPSQRCRIPNVNVDNLRNNIFGSNILKRHRLKSSKRLVDWLMVQNAALGEKYQRDEEQREFISERTWKKATTHDFYLGLESSWLYK